MLHFILQTGQAEMWTFVLDNFYWKIILVIQRRWNGQSDILAVMFVLFTCWVTRFIKCLLKKSSMCKIYSDWPLMSQLYWHERIMCKYIYFQKWHGFIFLSRECHLLSHYPELDLCTFCLPREKMVATFITLSNVFFSRSANCIPVGILFNEEVAPLQSLMSILC